jgi:anti-sigma factor RsiW
MTLLDAYLDGELDLVRHVQIEHHLEECTSCAEWCARRRALRSAIAAADLYERAPTSLRERLTATEATTMPLRPRPAARRQFLMLALAAGIAAVAIGLSYFTWSHLGTADDRLSSQVVASHVRSRQANHLLDVESSDQHVVKPWLVARLDFSPPVAKLSGSQFKLLGGRLDYLDDRPVAALVYRIRDHFINLFVWPDDRNPEQVAHTLQRQGFHLVHWRDGGMCFWAVSDLNETELREFAQLVSAANR